MGDGAKRTLGLPGDDSEFNTSGIVRSITKYGAPHLPREKSRLVLSDSMVRPSMVRASEKERQARRPNKLGRNPLISKDIECLGVYLNLIVFPGAM